MTLNWSRCGASPLLSGPEGDSVKDRQHWGPPGWPWELELLALVFVVTAILVPYYLQVVQAPDPSQMSLMAKADHARRQELTTWQDMEGFFWAIIIVGLYLVHIAMASASIDFMSTPFTHLFSPLVFSIITYYRLFKLKTVALAGTPIVSGKPLEIGIWISGVLVITYMVARIRMARLMLGFRDTDWDVSTSSLFDNTYSQLMVQIRPLIYAPRMCRACNKGILIEGWFYAMPLPFDSIQAIDAVQGTAMVSSSYCLATSLKSMVRIQVAEKAEPVLISPKDRVAFLRYCQQHVAAKSTTHGTATGTRPGVLRASSTASGTHKG